MDYRCFERNYYGEIKYAEEENITGYERIVGKNR